MERRLHRGNRHRTRRRDLVRRQAADHRRRGVSAKYIKEHPLAWSLDTDAIKDVVVSGPREAKIVTEPYANFARNVLSAMPIVPKHVWESVADPAKKQDEAALIGSGAYRLESSDVGKGSYRFVARDGYFLGAPFVRQVDFVPVGDELVALRADQLDLASTSGTSPVDVLDQFAKDSAYGLVEAGGANATALYFNLTQAPFNDPTVRTAIARTVDRQAFVDRILGGRGEAGNPGLLPPVNPYYADQSAVLPRDVARARKDLAGRTFTIPTLVANNAVRPAELLASQLAEIGTGSGDPGSHRKYVGRNESVLLHDLIFWQPRPAERVEQQLDRAELAGAVGREGHCLGGDRGEAAVLRERGVGKLDHAISPGLGWCGHCLDRAQVHRVEQCLHQVPLALEVAVDGRLVDSELVAEQLGREGI